MELAQSEMGSGSSSFLERSVGQVAQPLMQKVLLPVPASPISTSAKSRAVDGFCEIKAYLHAWTLRLFLPRGCKPRILENGAVEFVCRRSELEPRTRSLSRVCKKTGSGTKDSREIQLYERALEQL
jgi:hypothetical protein